MRNALFIVNGEVKWRHEIKKLKDIQRLFKQCCEDYRRYHHTPAKLELAIIVQEDGEYPPRPKRLR